jgi:hypothetical protein
MKRPSFQFYPADWQANSNLRRCTRAEKSVWLDVLCLMHDQEEYGVIRWSLKEIAEAAHCKVSELKSLQAKGVLKGADKGMKCEAYVYVPRSGRRDGEPVTLIPEQDGPIWYSSRFVRDEYVRKIRGDSTRFNDGKDAPESSPNDSPKGGIGEAPEGSPSGCQSDGSTSSSSSSPTVNNKDTVELKLDGGQVGEKQLTEIEKIQGIFEYWKRATGQKKAQLGDKRIKVIRAALKWGYSPRDLCRAIQGCALTPHNLGKNDRGQKYLGLHVCLGSEDQIDRFMANSKAPPVAPEKRPANQIPGWWNSDDLAKQQGALVGVNGPLSSESRETWHARIRAAIDNGGKPVSIVPAAPVPAPAVPEEPKVPLTPEQISERRAGLMSALKKGAPEAIE